MDNGLFRAGKNKEDYTVITKEPNYQNIIEL